MSHSARACSIVSPCTCGLWRPVAPVCRFVRQPAGKRLARVHVPTVTKPLPTADRPPCEGAPSEASQPPPPPPLAQAVSPPPPPWLLLDRAPAGRAAPWRAHAASRERLPSRVSTTFMRSPIVHQPPTAAWLGGPADCQVEHERETQGRARPRPRRHPHRSCEGQAASRRSRPRGPSRERRSRAASGRPPECTRGVRGDRRR